jgi:hypothetical protein
MSSLVRRFPDRLMSAATLIIGLVGLGLMTPLSVQAQKPRGSGGDEATPAFSDFKGVRIGMAAEEARKKLGTPRDKSAEQDFYVFNDTQAIQVMYDKKGAVSAISIDFMGGPSSAPSAKEVLGTDLEGKPDGSMFKMIRYPKAGYWVSYSRTAGDSPTITVTMQKIE